MLKWPAGARESDGVWAPHWYGHVWESTGFEPRSEATVVRLPSAGARVAEACMPHYQRLHAQRLRLVD